MSEGSASVPRRASVGVRVGDVVIGGGAPIVVQSMTNTDTADAEASAQSTPFHRLTQNLIHHRVWARMFSDADLC